jgi:hypothetical protein
MLIMKAHAAVVGEEISSVLLALEESNMVKRISTRTCITITNE